MVYPGKLVLVDTMRYIIVKPVFLGISIFKLNI